jgi:hypothetical protein
MATIINADTSDGLKLTSDTSGEIKLQSAGADIATVNSSGITMASGKLLASTGPAFSAYINVAQSISATTYTKIQFDKEHFDTNSNYDTTTYRFTPTVAGYYQINFGFKTSVAQTRTILVVYKNGAQERGIVDLQSATGGCVMSCLLYMNGSTDYIEPYAFLASAANSATGSVSSCFDAFLARAA